MSALDLRVVNLALATLQKAPADSLESPTNQWERWAAILLPEALEAALVTWWFPEVRGRAVIEASSGPADALTFGDGKKYALPVDCLKVHRVRNLDDQRWTREGRFIVCDTKGEIWVYYYRKIEIEACGPLLRRLIAAQLAVDIARAVSDSGTALDRAIAQYAKARAEACGSAGEEAGFANRRDYGSEQMARAGVSYGRFDAVERSKG